MRKLTYSDLKEMHEEYRLELRMASEDRDEKRVLEVTKWLEDINKKLNALKGGK